MITFKQFLAEAANYPLYHGTKLGRFVHIIRDNKMLSLYQDAHEDHPFAKKRTISMSRSKKFAFYWGKRIEWVGSLNLNAIPKDSVVIEFDREKLSRNYKILPYNHFPDAGTRPNRWFGNPLKKGQEYKSVDSNQYEERVSAPIKDINRYIVKIYMGKSTLEKFRNDFSYEYDIIKGKIQVQ